MLVRMAAPCCGNGGVHLCVHVCSYLPTPSSVQQSPLDDPDIKELMTILRHGQLPLPVMTLQDVFQALDACACLSAV